MPRMARVVLPGYPHHIVQRGHNKQLVFAEPEDYRYYLNGLRLWKQEYGVRLHAYCLMSNHVHLILEPDTGPEIGRLMKRLAGRQTRFVNRKQARTGTLWEGRFKSSPIDSDNYLLACCRYVELNPVRAKMVDFPEKYPWSSYPERVGFSSTMEMLDRDHDKRHSVPALLTDKKAYVAFVASGTPKAESTLIRKAVQRGQLTGDSHFVDEVERILGRRVEDRGPGRFAASRK